jgi:hypothetical protein
VRGFGRAREPFWGKPKGEWLNYGGDKLWPAPQGWDGEDQWPGPPDPVLDGGPYELAVIEARGSQVAVRLTSREDPRSGIQSLRVGRGPGRRRASRPGLHGGGRDV